MALDGVGMTEVAQKTKAGGMSGMLDRQTNAISELEEVIQNLNTALQPVIRARPTAQGPAEARGATLESPYGQQIESNTERINDAIKQIVVMRENLEF